MQSLDYLAHLERESARFLVALQGAASDARVPTCPDWTADDLLWHLAEVQWFWGEIVRTGAEDPESYQEPARPDDRAGLEAFYRAAGGGLHGGARRRRTRGRRVDVVERPDRGVHPATPGARGADTPAGRRADRRRAHADGSAAVVRRRRRGAARDVLRRSRLGAPTPPTTAARCASA